MLLFTTLLFSATAFAGLPPSAPCGTNLQCSARCINGEYISHRANGFICKPRNYGVPKPFVSGTCVSESSPKASSSIDDEKAKTFCTQYKGTLCIGPDGLQRCVVKTALKDQRGVADAFVNCGAEPVFWPSESDACLKLIGEKLPYDEVGWVEY